MDKPSVKEIDPPSQGEVEVRQNHVRYRTMLTVAAVIFLVIALIGVWQMLANLGAISEIPPPAFFLSLGVTFFSLLLMAVVLVEDSKYAERSRIDATHQTEVDMLHDQMERHQELLRLVTNHQTESITVFDKDNCYTFINDVAARNLGCTTDDVIGCHPKKILSAEEAKKLDVHLAWTRTLDEPRVAVERMVQENGETRFVQRYYARLSYRDESIILREDDITNLIVERERREQMLRQVIDTLVAVVDRRDPYATGHSKRVGQLAKAIAEEMGMDKLDIEASEIAGSLMNFGKVLVSRRILTKTSSLSAEELQRVRDSILVSADILGIIGFDGPVVPTLRQVLERYDGSGTPDGLKGESILLTARIVAAANAFVAFVSPRAHRDGLPFKEALNVMAQDSNKAFDERVLVAMTHYIENRPNKIDWLLAKQ